MSAGELASKTMHELQALIAAGTITLGMGDTGALVISRAQGIKVKAVGMVYGKAPYVLWIRKDVGVTQPKDLEGKTIGSAAGIQTGTTPKAQTA